MWYVVQTKRLSFSVSTQRLGVHSFSGAQSVCQLTCVSSLCVNRPQTTPLLCVISNSAPLPLSPNHYTSAAESWSKWAPNFLGDKMLSKNEPKPQDAIETDISEKVSGKHPEKTWYPPSPGNLSVTAASPSNWFIGMYYFPPIPFPPLASRHGPFLDEFSSLSFPLPKASNLTRQSHHRFSLWISFRSQRWLE